METKVSKTDFELGEMKAEKPEGLPGEPGDYIGSYKMYASTYGNIDLGNDRIRKGAFDKVIESGKMPKAFFMHDYYTAPAAVHTDMKSDSRGLIISGYFLNTTAGKDLQIQTRTRAIDASSIGYEVEVSEKSIVKGMEIREIISMKALPEVSFVTFPMNPKAQVIDAKSAPMDVRGFENFLCEYGFSRKEAKIIISRGFKALPVRDAAGVPCDEDKSLVESLARLEKVLKGESK